MPEQPALDRWFLSDVDGRLEIWRESALLDVTRDRDGEIDSYRTPVSWKAGDLIMGRDLETWEPGEDEADDMRREIAARMVADHNEVERLRAELAEVRKGKVEQMLGRIDDWSGDLARVVADRDRLTAQRNAVIDLVAQEHTDAAADVQAGGPRDQLDDLSVPVHDVLVALGVLDQDGMETGRG
ncbi:hypothetical protein [Actinomadura sp. WMMA1423]|uniref:hypothetical protein n=1 Tax=Actinomadura sp. WMMA1423 TaxID=2591108 RepID=UPI001146D046|nr:hypothetical protein [Actinomadura sp. WMMA1423]